MTVADLLDMILDPEWPLPRTATVRVCNADGSQRWEVDGAHGRAGGPDPEIVLELKETSR
jgi:hypothetical protein